MGQVQRRERRDIELWEFYEEEGRNGRRRKQNREENRENGKRRTIDQEDREHNRERGEVRRKRTQREENTTRKTAGDSNRSGAGRTAANRNSKNTDRPCTDRGAGQKRSMSLYEIEREPEPVQGYGHGASKTTARRLENTERRHENVPRAKSSRSAGEVSQIRYLQPYPAAGERQRRSEHAYRGNARPVQSIQRRRARRRKELLCRVQIAFLMVMCLVLIYFITGEIYRMVHRSPAKQPVPAIAERMIDEGRSSDNKIAPPQMIQDLLEINDYSRPGTKLDRINSVFVHYTANPGTSAAQNRSYFANLAQTHERSASAHLIIGYEGELIQCIPLEEQAYAVMTRNEDSVSIECCYLDEDGSFTQETYETLIHTLAWLLEEYDLSTEDILRHYDCGGKLCPLYYAENEGAWEQLRQDVASYIARAE